MILNRDWSSQLYTQLKQLRNYSLKEIQAKLFSGFIFTTATLYRDFISFSAVQIYDLSYIHLHLPRYYCYYKILLLFFHVGNWIPTAEFAGRAECKRKDGKIHSLFAEGSDPGSQMGGYGEKLANNFLTVLTV